MDLNNIPENFTLTAGYIKPGKFKRISYDMTYVMMDPKGLQLWDIIKFCHKRYVVKTVYSSTSAIIVANIFLLIGAYILKYWRKIKKAYGFK